MIPQKPAFFMERLSSMFSCEMGGCSVGTTDTSDISSGMTIPVYNVDEGHSFSSISNVSSFLNDKLKRRMQRMLELEEAPILKPPPRIQRTTFMEEQEAPPPPKDRKKRRNKKKRRGHRGGLVRPSKKQQQVW